MNQATEIYSREFDAVFFRLPPQVQGRIEARIRQMEISPYGIHWPELDEDLSFHGLLRGDYGQHQNVEPGGAANGSQLIPSQ